MLIGYVLLYLLSKVSFAVEIVLESESPLDLMSEFACSSFKISSDSVKVRPITSAR